MMVVSDRPSFIISIRRLPASLKLGSLILFIYIFVALTAGIWAPYPYNEVLTGKPLLPASSEHLLGTDQLGRDVFSRVVLGTKEVLFLSLTSTFVAVFTGGFLGLTSGFFGGTFDQLLMRFFEMIISIPLLIFALLILASAGPNLSGNRFLLIGTVAIVYIPRVARVTRAAALDLTTCAFVTAARLRGESTWNIVWRELLPNAANVLLVEFGVRAGYAPIFIGSLSFLGFGVRPPTPEWGLMISENRNAIVSNSIVVVAPALALAVLVIGLNLFADGLARYLSRSTFPGGK